MKKYFSHKVLLAVSFAVLSPLPFLLLSDSFSSRDFAATAVTVTVDKNVQTGTSDMQVGVTHTQYSLDPGNNPTALASGKQLLRDTAVFQNQHIMGWGARNPEPSPGTYDWADMDKRIKLITDTGGIPVITLCCAPDWMKGGAAGTTDWTKLETAPLPSHYQDFANLAKEVAKRYPQVKYYQVWNELKGFWNGSLNRWNYEGYTQLYNLVYTSVKSVTPDAKIGGPYPALRPNCGTSNRGEVAGIYGAVDSRALAAVKYWMTNKVGAEMIVLDGNIKCQDTGVTPADPFAALQFYTDVDSWIRKQTDLPIWWAEWYATSGCTSAAMCNAVYATAMANMLTSGTNVPLRWQPEENGANLRSTTIWSDPALATGGKAMPFYTVQKLFKDTFGKGTRLVKTVVSAPGTVLAVASDTKVLLVNKTAAGQTVLLNGSSVSLSPYAMQVVTLPGAIPVTSPVMSLSPAETTVSLTVLLHGIGKGGDNVSGAGAGNANPLTPERGVIVEVYNQTNQLVATVNGTIRYTSSIGNFQGTITLKTVSTGVYTLKVKVPHYLRKSVPGIITLTAGQTVGIPVISLVAGDSNDDNALSILDYNFFLDCFSDLEPAKNCADPRKKQAADISDDGDVNQFDYNLFLRELSVQGGQ